MTATPATSCRSGPSGPFVVTSNQPYFTFRCLSRFQLDGDPLGPAALGSYVTAQVNAPSGITITGATATGSVFYSSAGWAGNSYFQGGGTAWQNGQTVMTDAGLASAYWGYEVQCVAASCSGAGRLDLTSVKLTGSETQGPSLTPEGSDNLWFQTRRGEWVGCRSIGGTYAGAGMTPRA